MASLFTRDANGLQAWPDDRTTIAAPSRGRVEVLRHPVTRDSAIVFHDADIALYIPRGGSVVIEAEDEHGADNPRTERALRKALESVQADELRQHHAFRPHAQYQHSCVACGKPETNWRHDDGQGDDSEDDTNADTLTHYLKSSVNGHSPSCWMKEAFSFPRGTVVEMVTEASKDNYLIVNRAVSQ
jgi:hypothetical protein